MAGYRRPVGRPSKYREEHIPVARAIAALGGFDAEIAEALGVGVTTVYDWRARYPEFREACEPTEEQKLTAMRRSLFHRAMGYSHQAVKIVTASDKGVITDTKEVPYVEHYPPDVAAIKYYLNNKSAGEFAERQEVEQSGGVTVRVVGGLPRETGEDDKLPQVEKPKEET